MGVVAAKCTQCGAKIEVDDTKEAGICPYCNTPFVVEKAIKQYQAITNIENQTNFYYGESAFEKEKKQCKILLMLLNNLDLKYLKDHALKVMETNPENTLAQMIYDCGFSIENCNDTYFLSFNETPLRVYLEKECGNIDAETSITFIRALVLKLETEDNVTELVKIILDNVSKLNLSAEDLYMTYEKMALLIGDISKIQLALNVAKFSNVLGVINLFQQNNFGQNEFNDASNLKRMAGVMLYSRKAIAKAFQEQVNSSPLSEEKKTSIENRISVLLDGNKNQNGTQSETQQEKNTGSKAGLWAFIIICVAIFILILPFC